MSDQSISSEDIELPSGSDSEVYNPFDGDNQDNPYDNQYSSKSMESLNSPVKSILSDDYSYTFDQDDDFEPSKAYTEDFELDKSKSAFADFQLDKSKAYSEDFEYSESVGKLDKHSVQWCESTLLNKREDGIYYSNKKQSIPIVEMKSIQAELALQELGQEVVRIRNQQREVLRQRRIQLSEKKKRAHDRRMQYLSELQQFTQKCEMVSKENKELKDHIHILNTQIQSLKETKELFQSTSLTMDETIQQQKIEIDSLKSEFEKTANDLEKSKHFFEKSELEWKAEKSVLKETISKKTFQIEVIQAATEAMEAR